MTIFLELVKDCLENTDALCGGHVKLKVGTLFLYINRYDHD